MSIETACEHSASPSSAAVATTTAFSAGSALSNSFVSGSETATHPGLAADCCAWKARKSGRLTLAQLRVEGQQVLEGVGQARAGDHALDADAVPRALRRVLLLPVDSWLAPLLHTF